MDNTPTTLPSESITGKRRTFPSRMVSRATWISSSGEQANSLQSGETSPAVISPASLLRVPRAMQRSRSVITPHTLPSGPVIGRKPQFPFHISSAASPRLVSLWHVYGVQVMTSFTFMAFPLAFVCFSFDCHVDYFHGAVRIHGHRFGNAPQRPAIESTPAMRAHYNQICIPFFGRCKNGLCRRIVVHGNFRGDPQL